MDTSWEAWKAAGMPGYSYEDWRRQQLGTAPADSVARIKHNGASSEPGLSDTELVRRKRQEMRFEALDADLADVVLRDVSSGRVRRARAGSTRGLLGQAFNASAPIGRPSILGDL